MSCPVMMFFEFRTVQYYPSKLLLDCFPPIQLCNKRELLMFLIQPALSGSSDLSHDDSKQVLALKSEPHDAGHQIIVENE